MDIPVNIVFTFISVEMHEILNKTYAYRQNLRPYLVSGLNIWIVICPLSILHECTLKINVIVLHRPYNVFFDETSLNLFVIFCNQFIYCIPFMLETIYVSKLMHFVGSYDEKYICES